MPVAVVKFEMKIKISESFNTINGKIKEKTVPAPAKIFNTLKLFVVKENSGNFLSLKIRIIVIIINAIINEITR